ncbi:MAG: adenylyltransferase/cytidyltransferase family protein [Bauldia sp.]|nr:adenylyltransferase/cytidyltransferase family protein [Bauldia sp.]
MTRILTFGTFDLLHYGHMRLLQRIAERGSHVVVGLPVDGIVVAAKGRPPFYPYAIRREMLLHTRYVDEVVPHDGEVDGIGRIRLVAAKIALVRELGIGEVAMGDDWRGDYDFLKPHCRVVYLERTAGISTTAIREARYPVVD